jgi:hypothetical protein
MEEQVTTVDVPTAPTMSSAVIEEIINCTRQLVISRYRSGGRYRWAELRWRVMYAYVESLHEAAASEVPAADRREVFAAWQALVDDVFRIMLRVLIIFPTNSDDDGQPTASSQVLEGPAFRNHPSGDYLLRHYGE